MLYILSFVVLVACEEDSSLEIHRHDSKDASGTVSRFGHALIQREYARFDDKNRQQLNSEATYGESADIVALNEDRAISTNDDAKKKSKDSDEGNVERKMEKPADSDEEDAVREKKPSDADRLDIDAEVGAEKQDAKSERSTSDADIETDEVAEKKTKKKKGSAKKKKNAKKAKKKSKKGKKNARDADSEEGVGSSWGPTSILCLLSTATCGGLVLLSCVGSSKSKKKELNEDNIDDLSD